MEANIIYRIAKGDEKALDVFMDHYSEAIYRIAYGYVGNKESAEEVVSDVFFEVWRNRKKLLTVENMAAYLRIITTRRAITRYNNDETENFKGISIEESQDFFTIPVISPDEEIISREEIETLNRANDELPPKCRHVFTLAKLEKVSYNEISRLLDISVSTINYHIKFATDLLKKRLWHHDSS